jgi:hypothetical protein
LSTTSAVLRRLSALLGLAAGVWVVWTVLRDPGALRPLESPRLLWAMALGAVAYAALTWLLAAAWCWLAGVYGESIRLPTAYLVWGRSQLAKYLPGNLFHYVGRQMLGRRVGLSHGTLLGSSILETMSLVLAATAITLHRAGSAHAGTAALAPAAVVLAALLGWPVAERQLRRLHWIRADMAALPPASLFNLTRRLAPAMLAHAAFLLGAGGILLGLQVVGWDAAGITPRSVMEAYALAWLAGTLMPGAPAGLGVREMVLTLELQSTLGAADAAALSMALRLVTTVGDLLTALAAHARGLPEPDRRRPAAQVLCTPQEPAQVLDGKSAR